MIIVKRYERLTKIVENLAPDRPTSLQAAEAPLEVRDARFPTQIYE